MNALYIDDQGNAAGPYPIEQVREFLRDGVIAAGHLASASPQGPWVPVEQLVAQAGPPAIRSSLPAPTAVAGAPPQVVQVVVNNASRTSGLAIGAFVCALLSLIPWAGLLMLIIAAILVRLAFSELKRDPTLGGHGLVVAAQWIVGIIVTIYVLLFLTFCVGLTILGGIGHQMMAPPMR